MKPEAFLALESTFAQALSGALEGPGRRGDRRPLA